MTSHPELHALLCEPMVRDLSVRSYNALANAGLYTLEQVRMADLTRVKTMGPRLADFVRKRLADPGPHADTAFVRLVNEYRDSCWEWARGGATPADSLRIQKRYDDARAALFDHHDALLSRNA